LNRRKRSWRWAAKWNGFEIGVDEDQKLKGSARYRDKRPVAQKMWSTIMRTLKTVRAISGKALP